MEKLAGYTLGEKVVAGMDLPYGAWRRAFAGIRELPSDPPGWRLSLELPAAAPCPEGPETQILPHPPLAPE